MSEVVNSMSFEAKPLMLEVVRKERQAFYDVIDEASNWNADTRCEGWDVGDLVRHMIDVTEGYLGRWEMARKGEEAPAPLGTQVMGKTLNENVLALRSLSRDEAIERLKTASDKMVEIFESLTEDEWSNFIVTHSFMGPLPAYFYPAFHVMDYGVHSWDMRYGLGDKLGNLDERTAGVLIPYMLYALLPNTVEADSAAGADVTYGIEVTGDWGGKWRATMKDSKFEAAPEEGNFEGCDAVFTYSTSDYVLAMFQRFPGGAARGDPAVIDQVRNFFFTI